MKYMQILSLTTLHVYSTFFLLCVYQVDSQKKKKKRKTDKREKNAEAKGSVRFPERVSAKLSNCYRPRNLWMVGPKITLRDSRAMRRLRLKVRGMRKKTRRRCRVVVLASGVITNEIKGIKVPRCFTAADMKLRCVLGRKSLTRIQVVGRGWKKTERGEREREKIGGPVNVKRALKDSTGDLQLLQRK